MNKAFAAAIANQCGVRRQRMAKKKQADQEEEENVHP